MAQIMFIAEVPPNDGQTIGGPAYPHRWTDFLDVLSRTKLPAASGRQLAQGTWLLEPDASWPWLASAAAAAKGQGVAFKILLVEGAVTEMSAP